MKKRTLILTIAAVAVVLVAALIGFALFHSSNQATTTEKQPDGSYVALGDSVAAGFGLGAITDYDYCERTTQAYPLLVASKLNLNVKSVACSSARLNAGVLAEQTVDTVKKEPQLQQLFAQPTPKLITMTVGVNDTSWVSYLTRCFSGTCGTDDDTTAIKSATATMKADYKTTLTKIKENYQADLPTVIVTGYYKMFPRTAVTNCANLSGVDATEQQWWLARQDDINTAIQQAVSETGIGKYVSIDFSGHELCSSDSWIQPLTSKGVFHPTQAGQSAIANAVIAAY